eukprot:1527978-Rhodomonas_salina.1
MTVIRAVTTLQLFQRSGVQHPPAWSHSSGKGVRGSEITEVFSVTVQYSCFILQCSWLRLEGAVRYLFLKSSSSTV